jgi:hypothetical protein
MEKRNLVLNDSGVVFIENPRGYWIGETHLEGLTGMIGRQLFPDKYKAVPENVLAKAAERGHRIHEEIQVYDMFGEISSEEVKWYADMKKDKKFDVIDSEYLVTDGTHFASAIDKVIVKDGKVCLADVKTTYELDKEYISWQLSIYKYLFNLLNPDIEVDKLYAIWVRDGASLHEVPEIPQEEVIELLNCERQGIQYIRKDVATVEDEKAIEVVRQMSDVLVEIAELEAKRDAFKKQLEEMFEQYGVEKWDNDYFTITRVDGFTRETFDGKRFKEEHPELHKQYIKQTEVKPSIRIKLK